MKDRPKCFPKPLLGEHLGYYKWKLTSFFDYISKDGTVYTAPKGFITDGKSIPGLVLSIVGGHWGGLGSWIAVIHDILCREKTVSRLKADRIFLEGLERSGVGWLKRNTMYRFLRASSIILRKK